MIDNIILLITGTLHQRPISELIPKCHPLGSFEQMEAIHVAATPAELYNAVLVDTPLGSAGLHSFIYTFKSAGAPKPGMTSQKGKRSGAGFLGYGKPPSNTPRFRN